MIYTDEQLRTVLNICRISLEADEKISAARKFKESVDALGGRMNVETFQRTYWQRGDVPHYIDIVGSTVFIVEEKFNWWIRYCTALKEKFDVLSAVKTKANSLDVVTSILASLELGGVTDDEGKFSSLRVSSWKGERLDEESVKVADNAISSIEKAHASLSAEAKRLSGEIEEALNGLDLGIEASPE